MYALERKQNSKRIKPINMHETKINQINRLYYLIKGKHTHTHTQLPKLHANKTTTPTNKW